MLRSHRKYNSLIKLFSTVATSKTFAVNSDRDKTNVYDFSLRIFKNSKSSLIFTNFTHRSHEFSIYG